MTQYKKKDERVTIHGHRTDNGFSSTYNSWRAMKGRCNNPRNVRYKYYGALGIGYDILWDNFNAFLVDMGVKPEGTELHRRDKKKDYCEENCEWLGKREHTILHNTERDYNEDFKRRS